MKILGVKTTVDIIEIVDYSIYRIINYIVNKYEAI